MTSIVGASHPGLAGYGGAQDVVIALCLFLVGPVLSIYRRVVQDREPFRLREPEMLDTRSASALDGNPAAPVGS